MRRIFKKSIFLFLLIPFCSLLLAQQKKNETLFIDPVYKDILVSSNIPYGANYTYDSTYQTLYLDLYEAGEAVDYQRPLIIFFHAGGFISGDKVNDKTDAFSNYFVQRGYVLAAPNYRLGEDTLAIDPDSADAVISDFKNVYRAVQDAKASIRFFKRYASDFCIDTSAIFVAGTSAGAVMALLSAYWQQSEADAALNTAPLGTLENSSGNEGYSSHINSILSCWGGLPDTTWMSGETTPVYFFAGINDSVIPYTEGYNSDSLYLYGSYTLYRVAQENGVESYLKPYANTGHGFNASSSKMDTLLELAEPFLYNHLDDPLGTKLCNEFSLNVYPNPTSGPLTIFNGFQFLNYNGTATIYNMSGQLMLSTPFTVAPQTSITLNLDSFSSGIYLLKIEDQKQVRVYRIVVAHA